MLLFIEFGDQKYKQNSYVAIYVCSTHNFL